MCKRTALAESGSCPGSCISTILSSDWPSCTASLTTWKEKMLSKDERLKKPSVHRGLPCLCCLVLMLQRGDWMGKGCAAHTLSCEGFGESVGRKTKEGKVYYNGSL